MHASKQVQQTPIRQDLTAYSVFIARRSNTQAELSYHADFRRGIGELARPLLTPDEASVATEALECVENRWRWSRHAS